MKNLFKIINLSLTIFLLAIAGSAYLYWSEVCTGSCSEFTVRGVLSPVLWGSLGFSLSAATLLLFSSRIFKHWLVGVFSWFLPLSFIMIQAIDIHNLAFLAMPRDVIAWTLALVLYLLTTIFIIGDSLWQYRVGRFSKRDLLWLLWLLPITGLMAYIFDVSIF